MRKQIEEMYQEFLSYKHKTECEDFSYKAMCEHFYNIGYRKESDTAREIFEWLEKHCFFNGFEIVETYFKERYNLD